VIKKAYGEYWDLVEPYVDYDGWIDIDNLSYLSIPFKYRTSDLETKDSQYWRPKSLQGIENNNGWIKIESESDLPNAEVDCFVFHVGKYAEFAVWDNELKDFYSGLQKINHITHYQPTQKPNAPHF